MTSVDASLAIGGITVTGTPLAEGDTGYELIAMGFDAIQRRRDVVTSPWVKGEAEVASVQGALSYTFVINAVGSSMGDAIDMTADIINEVQQKTWSLTETVESYSQTYTCCAASSIDAAYDRNYFINHRRQITVTVPVKRA